MSEVETPPVVSPTVAPRKIRRGVRVVNKETGEVRMILEDIHAEQSEAVEQVTLHDLLCPGKFIKLQVGKLLKLPPINIKGIMEITRLQESSQLPKLPAEWKVPDLVLVATALVNQNLPPVEQITTEELTRWVNADEIPVLSQLVMEIMRPLLEEAAAR